MSETSQLILLIGLLIGIYFLTRKIQTWQVVRAYKTIIADLEKAGALDSASAVALPYSKVNILRVGRRDFKPKALQFLLANNMVGMTESGKYYLLDKNLLSNLE